MIRHIHGHIYRISIRVIVLVSGRWFAALFAGFYNCLSIVAFKFYTYISLPDSAVEEGDVGVYNVIREDIIFFRGIGFGGMELVKLFFNYGDFSGEFFTEV